MLISSNYKPIGVTICITEDFLDEYSKNKWKNSVKCGHDVLEDILLNCNYIPSKLKLNQLYQPKNKFLIFENLFNLEYNAFLCV